MANRLQFETSPYLLQHADNPVDWYPWGSEALARATELSRPIFLSIGYAACHWCHVMAHESFEDADVAEYMNANFVNIKVDREERPDLDGVYMDAVVSLVGQGGWPLSVFLAPDGKPFFGGTYYPPRPQHGLPSFREVLEAVTEAWRERREEVVTSGEKIAARLRTSRPQPEAASLDPQTLEQAAEALLRTYDWTHGGWGGAPKFPQPLVIEALLQRSHRHGDRLARDMALDALDKMASGGMYDIVGGGFHRYSVDVEWRIPHFEKMLYDNALLARAYLHGWQVGGKPHLLDVVHGTLGFVLAELQDPEGGFYSSLDADSEGEEGKFYLWTPSEVRNAVQDPAHAAFVFAALGIGPGGDVEGRTTLRLAERLDRLAEKNGLVPAVARGVVEEALVALKRQRGNRASPACDDKVLAEWNGLLLRALAEAARVTGKDDYRSAATRLGAFLAERMLSAGRLSRSWRKGQTHGTGFLADYAAVGDGMLALYETVLDQRWLHLAEELAETIRSRFADSAGGFYDTPDDHETLITRPKALQDSPIPSGNASAVGLFLRLHALTGEQRYLDQAEQALRGIQADVGRYPAAFAAWLADFDLALGPVQQLAIAGDPNGPDALALLKVAWNRYLPGMVIAVGQPGGTGQPHLLDEKTLIDGRATAYLCEGFVCRMPTTDPDVLSAQLDWAPASS